MQKVEDASSKAAEAVLGVPAERLRHVTGRQMGKDLAQGASDHARIENKDAEAEALLNEWITEKVQLHDDDPADPDLEEVDPWRKQALGSRARQEWDSLLNGNLEELGLDSLDTAWTRPKKSDDDPYANIYNLDDDEAVSTVMRTMLEKQVVKDDFTRDLGFEQKSHDPRTKMEMRHQRVKENREKRERELEKKRKETESKKQARLTARQIVMKEEKEKEIQAKREELEVRKEMARLRKEMQEAQRKAAEEKAKKQQEQEELAWRAREEFERQQEEEQQEILRLQQERKERRMAKLAQQELEKARQAAEILRVLQKYFTAWYDVVLHRRLQYGKARAMADWRLRLRAWNAWRSYVRSQRVSVETKQHEQKLIDENRKNVVASRHHHLSVLRKHFSNWRAFVKQEQEKRELEAAQEQTRNKMMSLLHAVADGSLWSARTQEQEAVEEERGGEKRSGRGREGAKSERWDRQRSHSDHGTVLRNGSSTDREAVDNFFSQPNRRTAWGDGESSQAPPSRSSSRSAQSSASATNISRQGHRVPTEPWQVTRKHVQLTKEEIANLGQGDLEDLEDIGEGHSDLQVRRRFGTQPWMNRHYVVNNFEHRFTAQQKMLREQQQEIKEQKRMIEELKFTQQQQKLRQQLSGQHGAAEGQTASSPELQQPATGSSGAEMPQAKETSKRHSGSAKSSPAVDLKKRELSSPKSSPKTPSSHTVTDGGDSGGSDLPTDRTGCSDRTSATSTTATTNTQANSRYLQVLKNMEERAAERARLKAEREEKRRLAEEARLEKLKAEEEEMKRKEEEEKQARIQAYREKKRLEKQKEQEKQKELERQKELNAKADNHYQKSLMKWRAFVPMRRLVEMAQEKMEMAATHNNHQILRRVLYAWKQYTDEITAENKEMADELHGKIVVRRCFQSWKNDNLFGQPNRRTAWGDGESSQAPPSRSSSRSAQSSASATNISRQGHRVPTEPWQVTRKHVQLTKEEIANLGQGDLEDLEDVGEGHSDLQVRRRFGTQPWMNRHYVVNNFEHRFTAQQKMLREQQQEIKEQKRMIEELKFTQQQQKLRQQLSGQHGAAEGQAASSPGLQQPATGSEGAEMPQAKETSKRHSGSAKSSPAVDLKKRELSSPKSSPKTPSSHTVTDGGDSGGSDLPTDRTGCSDRMSATSTTATTNTQANSRYVQVLKNMEERAAERARLKAEREEKRRLAEEARLEKLKAEEEEMKRKEEEEKQTRIQADREKKRLEKQKEQEKQKELERQKELNAKADNHYQKSLMKWRAFVPMRRLVEMAQEKMEMATTHNNHQILRRVLHAWKQYTDEITAEKKEMADEQHGKIVVRRCFQSWKNYKYRMIFLERRAVRHHRDMLLPKLFDAWRVYTVQEKQAEAERIQQAKEFYPRSLVKKVFHAWRRLPQELKREAEREKIRMEMRKKVTDLLPDFQPPSVAQSTDSTL